MPTPDDAVAIIAAEILRRSGNPGSALTFANAQMRAAEDDEARRRWAEISGFLATREDRDG